MCWTVVVIGEAQYAELETFICRVSELRHQDVGTFPGDSASVVVFVLLNLSIYCYCNVPIPSKRLVTMTIAERTPDFSTSHVAVKRIVLKLEFCNNSSHTV